MTLAADLANDGLAAVGIATALRRLARRVAEGERDRADEPEEDELDTVVLGGGSSCDRSSSEMRPISGRAATRSSAIAPIRMRCCRGSWSRALAASMTTIVALCSSAFSP